MNYTYSIRRVDPKLALVGVVYHVDGRADYYKNFNTTDFTAANIDSMVADFAPEMRRYWEDYDARSDTSEVSVGDGSAGVAELVIYETSPEIDPITQNLVQTETFDAATQTRTFGWTVEAATQAEVSERKASATRAAQSDPIKLQKAQALISLKTIDPATLSDEELGDIAVLYPVWETGVAYAANDIRLYDDSLWKCVQAHTAQADWAPEFVPALWTKYRDPNSGPSPWVQPTGAQDAYVIGDRVTHDNPNDASNIWVYESAIDANTTEPGRDGTFDRWWTPIEVA